MKVEVKIPSPGESITEVEAVRWLKNSGDLVEQDEEILEIESEKAALVVTATASGVLETIAKLGEPLAVGSVAAVIDTKKSATHKPAKPENKELPAAQSATSAPAGQKPATKTQVSPPVASPAASKIIAEQGLQPEQLPTSGKGGRITKADALSAADHASKTTAPNLQAQPPAPGTPNANSTATPSTEHSGVRYQKLSPLRQKLAERLVHVTQQTASLTTFNEVDLSAVKAARRKYKETFQKKYGINLGFMSFFSKACTIALKDFPAVNVQLEGDQMLLFDSVHLGIAVSSDRGLVVPVVKNADRLSLAEIETQIFELAQKARNSRLSLDEMSGGTFTITNGGVFGSLLSTPILNPPQSAILGMHRIQERPMGVDGQIVLRPMMYLALTYDHRVIDGKTSVSFLVCVKQLLEDPVRMLLQM